MNSSAPLPRLPPDVVAARACLVANLLVLPGLGTRLAGRPGAWPQMALALLGFAALMVWGLRFLSRWIVEGRLVGNDPPWSWLGLAGLALSLATWAWGFASGLAMLREAGRGEKAPA
ncbi:MAG: hypothetical protein IT578_07090 [Verrucomicrobiae bacterium]|nr:hypothetical protein [Verrucomicrobiae bacterium]